VIEINAIFASRSDDWQMRTDARLSYVHGASNEPLKGQTVGACFDATVQR
jgi:hypothetical protein